MTGKSLSGTTTVAVAGILVVLLMMAGCLGNDQTAAPERITVTGGSTTVMPIAEQAREAFEAQDASAEIMVSGGGGSSVGGVKAAGEGTADIGMSSRDLKPEETAGYPDLVKHHIADDAILLIVNPGNSVESLTLDEVRGGIYNGTYTNWNQVGGSEAQIVVVGRDSASGTREFFSEFVMDEEDFTRTQEEFNSNGGIQQKVSQTPGAFGYVGLGYTEGVKPLALDVGEPALSPRSRTSRTGRIPSAGRSTC